MKVYLIWERESYCDYDVINVLLDEEKAKEYVDRKNKEAHDDDRFRYEERTVGVQTQGQW